MKQFFIERIAGFWDFVDRFGDQIQWVWNAWQFFRCKIIHFHGYRFEIVNNHGVVWSECLICHKKWSRS